MRQKKTIKQQKKFKVSQTCFAALLSKITWKRTFFTRKVVRPWKFVDLAHNAPWLPALFERHFFFLTLWLAGPLRVYLGAEQLKAIVCVQTLNFPSRATRASRSPCFHRARWCDRRVVFETHSRITCQVTNWVAAFIFERRNNLHNCTREGGIFFALLPSRATWASRSPRFRLCSPEIGRKISPVLQAKQVHERLLSTFQSLATKHSLVSFQSPTNFNFMKHFKVIIASREHLKFDVVNSKEKEGMTSEIPLSRDLILMKARN